MNKYKIQIGNWSIEFYKSLGAEVMDEWTTYRLTGDTLMEMAK